LYNLGYSRLPTNPGSQIQVVRLKLNGPCLRPAISRLRQGDSKSDPTLGRPRQIPRSARHPQRAPWTSGYLSKNTQSGSIKSLTRSEPSRPRLATMLRWPFGPFSLLHRSGASLNPKIGYSIRRGAEYRAWASTTLRNPLRKLIDPMLTKRMPSFHPGHREDTIYGGSSAGRQVIDFHYIL
jgi:hypothetical protein